MYLDDSLIISTWLVPDQRDAGFTLIKDLQ